MAKEIIAFRIDPALRKRLIKIADKQNRNISNMIETLIRQGITKSENKESDSNKNQS